MNHNPRAGEFTAIALMVLSSFLTSIGDALVKALGGDISVWQLYILRAVIALPLLLLVIAALAPIRLRPHRPGWLAVRSLLMVTMWVLFYAALPSVGLGVASAGLYTFPLFLVLIGAVLGVERFTVRRLLSLALGFGGVLLVLRPTGALFSIASLLPIGAALCYALQALVTRHRCDQESPWVISLGMNLAFPIVGLIGLSSTPLLSQQNTPGATTAFLLSGWHATTSTVWIVVALLAGIIVAASASMAAAYQRGDSPVIATFDYSHLVFATIWGVWFFDEFIDLPIVAGMIGIILAGVIVLGGYPTRTREGSDSEIG